MQVGFTLQASVDGNLSSRDSEQKNTRDKQAWGLQASYAQNTMSISPSGVSVAFTGTSTNFASFYQLELDPTISVKFAIGYDSLIGAGHATSAVCSGSTNCSVNISYLGLDTLVRYTFSRSKTLNIWGGAGLAFLVPISKSSNALDTSKISSNQRMEVALGTDYYYSRNRFVPFEFKFSMFPSSSTASISQMFLALGWGQYF